MLAEYWTHYEQYPHQASFSEDQVNDISGILTQLVVGESQYRDYDKLTHVF